MNNNNTLHKDNGAAKNVNISGKGMDAYNIAVADTHILNFASKHLQVKFVKNNYHLNVPNIAFLGLGQGGGRMAVKASTFGFPTYIFNSSKADMREHEDLLDENRRIFTPMRNSNDDVMASMQGTAKDIQLGTEIAEQNAKTVYWDIFNREDVRNADFVFLCASLGGGTGSGAVNAITRGLQAFREYDYKLKHNKDLSYNNVGLVLSLPSKSELGIEYRRNAIVALQEVLALIANKNVGVVYIIDNDYFENSQLYSDYSSKHNVDSRTFSNAVMASSLIELFSFLTLRGSMSIDSTELQKFLGTPGFLNIKRVVQETELIKELIVQNSNKKTVSNEEIKSIAEKFANEVIYSPDLLCQFDESNIDSVIAAMTQVIAGQDIQEEFLVEILNQLSLKYKVTMDRGIADMQSQNGSVSVFSAYITNTHPPRIADLKAEYEEALRIEKEREEKASQSLSLFADFNANTNVKTRNSLLNEEKKETNPMDFFGSPKKATSDTTSESPVTGFSWDNFKK